MTKNNDDQLVFLPLAGTGEIGMNMNLYGYGPDIDEMKWLLVDVGITFGDDSLPGIDIIMADHGFIAERRNNLVGVFITHAHEDHVGALAYLWPDLQCQIYATPFTACIIKLKFEERGVDLTGFLNIVDLDSSFKIGPFGIELSTMAHSIPEPNSMFITTDLGTIYHTGDWKIDPDPLIGSPNPRNFKEKYKNKITAMICDSTNVMTKGRSGSELTVRKNLVKVVKKLKNRVFVTSFASNVARLETVAYVAKETNRSLVVVGRSMHRMISVARDVGILKDIKIILNEKEAAKKKKSELLYLCTGSQGEPRGAMMRIANNDFQGIEIDKDDAVIFSSKIIPGNEKKLYGMFNKLSEMLVEVITEYDEDIHVSGHPCEDEMIDMYNWIKPEISVPVHGEHRHLKYHSELAKSLDVKHPMLIQNGDILRLAPGDPEVIDQCMSGRLYYDGNKLVPSDSYHLSERKRMSFNGILNITCVLNKKLKLSSPPIISCNGIDLYDEFDDDIIDSLEEEIYNFFDNTNNLSKKDSKVHKKLESVSKNFIFKRTRKKPLTNIHLVHI